MKSKIPFDKFFNNISSKPYQISKDKYLDEGLYPVIDQGQKHIVGYSNDDSKLHKIEHPIIIFGDHTRIIKYIDFDFIIGADGTKILYTDDSILPKYAYYQLLYTRIESLGYSRHYKLLKEKEFIKPPLIQQKQIAKTLDKANELITLRKESITKLDELSKSIFIDMFGDPVSNPKGWEATICINEATCIVPGRDKPKSFTGETKWLTTSDLNNLGLINIEKIKLGLSPSEIELVRAKIIPLDSVVFTCVGDLGIVSILKNNVVMNQQLHSFQCSENLNNIFLMFNINYQKGYMYKYASQTTVPYMNKTVCNNIPLILPPLELQKKFATIIEKIEKQKALYTQELEKLQENFDALLQKSFQE